MTTIGQTSLGADLLSAAHFLSRGSESVRAVVANEDNRFTGALDDHRRLSEKEQLPMAIVGDLAAIRYGYPAITQDIDVAVAKDQLDRLLLSAPRYGLRVAWEGASGWHTFSHGDVEINVVPEGGRARNSAPTTIPGPAALGVTFGLDYAALEGWMELKISSGRQKDHAQIVEVLKRTSPDDMGRVRNHLTRVHPHYVEQFERFCQLADEENEQEKERGYRR